MDGFHIGKGLKKFNGSMGTTLELDEQYVCAASHTHSVQNIVGAPSWSDMNDFRAEIKQELQYMKDFLIYKQVMIDENEFNEFVESRKVAKKLLDASKPKRTGLNAELLDGYHVTDVKVMMSPHSHVISTPVSFVYQPYLPLMNDPDKEDK